MSQASGGSLPTPSQRVLRVAYWLVPPLFCLGLYWYALNSWFREDDFLWLQQHFKVQSWRDLWTVLFAPTAHGTFRPLSERAYFLIFGSLFPLDALPFRIWAFLTQFANLALVASIARRMTGSRLAGFLAPVFWTANSNLAVAMSWNSAYMQLLCGFCLLLAFHFLLRHIETGRRRYYWLQWAVFLAGFAAMETTLVYPALAAAYTLLCARKHFRSTLPLFAASLGFAVFHLVIAPQEASGPYTLYFDSSLPVTLLTYWRWGLEPRNLHLLVGYPAWVGPSVVAFLTLALLGFLVCAVWRRNWLPLVFAAWFVILLGPVLPLREHRSPYYLTLPTLGLALLAACALVTAWRAKPLWRAVGVLSAAAYFLVEAPGAWAAVKWEYQRGEEAEALVWGVLRARELHPGQTILLTGVSHRLFWTTVWDGAFAAAGVGEVYLDPDSAARIQPLPGRSDLARHILPAELVASALKRGEVVVYEAGGPRLRNVTRIYAAGLKVSPLLPPRRVDVSNPLAAHLLGPTWYPPGDNHRWMPQRATVRLAGPRSATERLHVSGYCPAAHLLAGPLEMTVAVEGGVLSTVPITRGDALFRFDFPLPAHWVGRPALEIEIQVNRTFRPPAGDRELGLAFGVFEIR